METYLRGSQRQVEFPAFCGPSVRQGPFAERAFPPAGISYSNDAPFGERPLPRFMRRDSPSAKPFEQFAVNAAKTAVAEDHYYLASFRMSGQVRHDRIGIRQVNGGFAGGREVVQ